MATSLSPIKTPGFIFEPLLAPIVEQHVSARFALAPHSYAKAMHTEVELKRPTISRCGLAKERIKLRTPLAKLLRVVTE